jgi:hypothetical protein
MHTGVPNSPFSRAIPLLQRSIKALGEDQDLPDPQLHRVGTIGDRGLSQSILCEIRVSAPGIFVGSDTTLTQQQIVGCERRLRTLPPTEYTDISGAVKYATLALEGSDTAARGIVMFTDLEEDLPRGRETAVANLTGICLVVFYEITGNTATTPHQLDDRIRQWADRFRTWGAKGAQFRLAAGFNPQDLDAFFLKCSSKRS